MLDKCPLVTRFPVPLTWAHDPLLWCRWEGIDDRATRVVEHTDASLTAPGTGFVYMPGPELKSVPSLSTNIHFRVPPSALLLGPGATGSAQAEPHLPSVWT